MNFVFLIFFHFWKKLPIVSNQTSYDINWILDSMKESHARAEHVSLQSMWANGWSKEKSATKHSNYVTVDWAKQKKNLIKIQMVSKKNTNDLLWWR